MFSVSVNIAVLHQDEILLTQREDFETWVLPSGRVEAGESLAQAAIREAKEETGIEVELTRLVGIYSRSGNLTPSYTALFAARPVGGKPKLQRGETIAVEWFRFEELPSPLHAGQSRRIRDAIAGVSGLVVRQETRFTGTSHSSYKEILDLISESGLFPQDFYMRKLNEVEIREVVEVGKG